MGSAFYQLCPGYSGTLTPTALMAIRPWETFTFTYHTEMANSVDPDDTTHYDHFISICAII